jgi:hypothetical protein
MPKKEFNSWLAEENEKYGLTDNDWAGLKKTAILTFILDGENKVRSSHNGIIVFRHWDSEKTIMPGETWICSLMLKERTYFATGVKRIDSSHMFELNKDQADEIASTIWERHRETIEPLLEEKYKDVAAKKIEQFVAETKQKYEAEITMLKDTVNRFEQKDTENKNIISSLHEKLNAAENEKISRPAAAVVPALSSYTALQASVKRDGPDSISSDLFSRSRYFVHLSADGRILVVRPHDNGNVVCMNNVIELNGLSMVSSFNGPQEMVSEYNPTYGGIQIYL